MNRKNWVTDTKTHYKMYKSGRNWVVAGISLLSFGAFLAGGAGFAHADTATDPVSEAPTTKTVVTPVAAVETTPTEVAAETPVTPVEETPAAPEVKPEGSPVVAEEVVPKVTEPAASTQIETPEVAQPAMEQATPEPATPEPAQPVAEKPVVTRRSAPSPRAAQVPTAAVKSPITVTSEAVTPTVEAGDSAVFKVTFDATGIKTNYHNAKLTLTLPTIDGTTLGNQLADLAVAGVTPIINTKGQLEYDFATLSETSANIVLNFKTDRTQAKDGEKLALTVTFTADELDLAPTVSATSGPATVSNNKVVGSVTNHIGSIKDSAGETHINPTQNDSVVWNWAVNIPTSQNGVKLIQAGKNIIFTYTLPKGLTYVGMDSADGLTNPTPTVVVDSATGITTLTWTQPASSLADQVANDQTYKFGVKTTVDDDVANYEELATTGQYTATYTDGTTDTETSSALTDATVTVTPYDPSTLPTTSGKVAASVSAGPADGKGHTTLDYTSGDPTVYIEDNPILLTYDVLTGVYGSQQTSSTYPNLKYFGMHQEFDGNQVLQTIQLNPAVYRPNMSYKDQPLTVYPFVTLAVKYAGENTTNQYQVLSSNIDTSKKNVFTRTDLLAMGLDASKDVIDVFMYYHLDADGQALPTDPDTWYFNIKPTNTNNTTNGVSSNIDYASLPADSGAPNGTAQEFFFTTSVKDGYTGTLTNQFVPQYGVNAPISAHHDHYFTLGDWRVFAKEAGGQYTWLKNPNLVEVASRPTGTTKIVNTSTSLVGTADSKEIAAGTHQVKVDFGVANGSLGNLVASGKDFTTYTLLPKGVTFDAANTVADGEKTVSVSDGNYQGTGQQLVKIDWKGLSYVAPKQTVETQFAVNIANDAPKDVVFKTYVDLGDNDYEVQTATPNPSVTDTSKVTDISEITGVGSAATSLAASGVTYTIIKNSVTQVTQQVKGQNGATFADSATVKPGDKVTINLNTTTNTDKELTSLDLVDVLPVVGDTGLTTNAERGSDYQAKLTGPVTLPADWVGKVQVLYTTDSGVTTDPASAAWTDTVDDYATVTAFRLVLDPATGATINGQNQTVSFEVEVPDTATNGQVAYNRFAITANGLQYTEPLQVAIKVNVPANPGSGGGTTVPGTGGSTGGSGGEVTGPGTGAGTGSGNETGSGTVTPGTTTPSEAGQPGSTGTSESTGNNPITVATSGNTTAAATTANGNKLVATRAHANGASDDNVGNSDNGTLPQTSESSATIWAIVGLALSVNLIGLVGFRKKWQYK